MTDHDFTRRLTLIGGQTKPDDWLVFYQGKEVGRVRLNRIGLAHVWIWHTWTHPAFNGRENGLDEALGAMKDAVLTLPERSRQRVETSGMKTARGV